MPFAPQDPSFFDTKAVEAELARVTEICDGCRRCHRRCPSFDHMLERVDENEGDLSRVTPADYRRIVDLCWQMQAVLRPLSLHSPPPFRHRLSETHTPGQGSPGEGGGSDPSGSHPRKCRRSRSPGLGDSPLSNWANGFKPHRVLMEAVIGIDRNRNLPRFHHKTPAGSGSAAVPGRGRWRPPRRRLLPTARFRPCRSKPRGDRSPSHPSACCGKPTGFPRSIEDQWKSSGRRN